MFSAIVFMLHCSCTGITRAPVANLNDTTSHREGVMCSKGCGSVLKGPLDGGRGVGNALRLEG